MHRDIDGTTETELVQLAREGDIHAFEELYRAYNDRIFNFAKRIMGSGDDAGDVTQETFIRAWHALPRLRADAVFSVWLHRIALNRSRDVIKKHGREQTVSIDDSQSNDDWEPLQIESDSPTPERALMSGEMQNAVHRAVDSLNAEHKLVVLMHHMEGIGVESISAILGVPKGTVMSRLSRARVVLRRKLSPYVEGEEREYGNK